MISNHYTECVCNHLTHFAVLMEFADNADDGEVNIFFSLVQKESHADLKKVHSGIKTIAFILFININISFDTDKIIMTFTVFQSGKNSFAN